MKTYSWDGGRRLVRYDEDEVAIIQMMLAEASAPIDVVHDLQKQGYEKSRAMELVIIAGRLG